MTRPSDGEEGEQTKVRYLYVSLYGCVCECVCVCVCATVVGRREKWAEERGSNPMLSPLLDALSPLVRTSVLELDRKGAEKSAKR